jgi:type I restriction enzyme S subunit
MNLDHEIQRRLVRQHLIEANEFPPIPDGWGVERLRFLFRESKERNGDTPVGQMLSVSEYRGVVPREYDTEEQKRTDEELANYRVVHPGQLAVNSMWLNHLGLGVSDHEGHVSPAYEVYDISERLDRRFVHHLMRSNYYLKIYMRYLYGIRPNSFQIKADDWKSIPIIVPDLTTQRQIADFLDRETARIDLLIEKKQRMVELLGRRAKAVIDRYATVGIGTPQLKDSNGFWLGSVAAHWTVAPLKRFARLQSGYAFKADTFTDSGIKLVRMNNIKRGSLDLEEAVCVPREDNNPQVSLRIGDIVLGMSGSIGESGSLGNFGVVRQQDLPCLLNQRVGRFQLDSRKMTTDFLMLVIQSTAFLDPIFLAATSTAQFNISPTQVGSIAVAAPPLAEQDEIVKAAQAALVGLREVQSRTETSITHLHEYRSALITAAVTGQIDPATHTRAGSTDRPLEAIEAEGAT